MARTLDRPERLLAGFFVVLCLPFVAVAFVGLRSAGHEGPLATALALLPLALFVVGFRAVAARFRAAPSALGVAGLAARLLVTTVVAGAVPSGLLLALHAAHVPPTGTYVVVATPEGACLVERHGGTLRTGDDHPEALVPAMRALVATRAALPVVDLSAMVGTRVRTYRKGLVAAVGVVTDVYGTRAGRRVWVGVRLDDGRRTEVAILSVCAEPR